jgi:hypothetical protein
MSSRYNRLWKAICLLLLCLVLLTKLLLTGPFWAWKFSDLDLETHWSQSSQEIVDIPEAEVTLDETVIQVYGPGLTVGGELLPSIPGLLSKKPENLASSDTM